MPGEAAPETPGFLSGGGQLGRLIAGYDWSRTPLGPIERWPAHMRTATAVMLRSRVPIVMLWGERGVMIYNDAYSEFAGARHPALLGSNVREGWGEVADFNDNVMKVGLAGGTLNYRDQELTLHRHGRAEQVWMNLDYSPLLDESGTPVGVMAVVVETSAKVLAERRLLGERERLAALFEQAPSFMAMLEGPEHRFVLVNRSYVRLVGHRPLLGLTVPQALPDAESQGYVRLLDEVYRTGTAYTDHGARYDSQVVPGGPVAERYVDFVFQPIRAESGEVTGIFIEGVETTARVLAERRREGLARFAEELHRLDDPASVGYAAARLIGTLLDVSRVGYATIDDVAETLHVDRDWTAPGVESLAGVLRLRDYGSFIDSLKRNEFVRIDDVREDARTREAASALEARSARSFVNVPVVEQGRLVAVLYVNHAQVRCWSDEELDFVREVAQRARTAVERVKGEGAREAEAHARREAQAQMSALDQRFRALVTATSDMVYQMDAQWTEMRQLQGRGFLADTQGPSSDWFERYIPEPDRIRVREAIAEALRTRSIFELEHQVFEADGDIGWVFSRAIPMLDEQGRVTGWFGAASDVSRRKRVEQELQLSEERLRDADRRKDEFLATLAHELRNPLAPIRNAVHLLGLLGQDERIGKVREILDRQVSHMVRLVDDLLEVSRISRGRITLQREHVRLRRVIDAAVEASLPGIERAGHRLAVTAGHENAWVHADPVRLAQVFVNLLNNAARYTPARGSIELSVARQGDDVAVTVADDGIGIAAEQLPRLFEMFSQVDPGPGHALGGLGIGLSLSRRLMQLHGGALHGHSDGLGRGSRFTAVLPLAVEGAREAEPAVAPPEAQPRAPRRVLVVDDNRDAAESTALLLSTLGAQVQVVYDGASALDVARQWMPEVVLLDIGMPGMDGHQVARSLRAQVGPRVPFLVALTGWGQAQDRERTRHSGFDHHMVKPVEMKTLQWLLATLDM